MTLQTPIYDMIKSNNFILRIIPCNLQFHMFILCIMYTADMRLKYLFCGPFVSGEHQTAVACFRAKLDCHVWQLILPCLAMYGSLPSYPSILRSTGPEVNLNPLTPLLLEPVTNTNTVNAINQKSSFKSHKYHLIYIFKSRSVANLELRYPLTFSAGWMY